MTRRAHRNAEIMARINLARSGVLTINDVRKMHGLPPMSGGDKFVPRPLLGLGSRPLVAAKPARLVPHWRSEMLVIVALVVFYVAVNVFVGR